VSSRRHLPRTSAGLALSAAVLMSACGTQVSHARVVAGAGLAGAVQQGGSNDPGVTAPGSATSGGGTGGGTTGAPSGSTTGVPGSSGGSGTTGVVGGTTGTSGSAGTAGSTGTASGSRGGTTGSSGAAPAVAGGCGKGSGTIKIGNVGPYSATAAGATASPARDILKVWEAEVNGKGGICGRKVQVLTRDDKGSASQNASEVRDLVENEKVVAFIGNINTVAGGGQPSYLEGKKVPVIGGDLIVPAWFSSPVYFPQGVDANEVNYAHLKLVQAKPNGTKVAFLYCAEFAACTDGYNAFIKNKIPEKAGSQIVYAKKVSLTAISFASECQEAKKAGAGALYAGGDASFVERVANSCGQQGISFAYLVSGQTVSDSQKSNQYLNNNMYVATTVQPWTATNTPGSKLFSDSIARYGPNVSKTGNSMGNWASALLAEHAIQAIGDAPVNPTSVLAALRQVKGYTNQGLSGPLTFHSGKQETSHCVGGVLLSGGNFTSVNGGSLSCRSGAPLG
jgi:branched-chain amino acid transport system substrate-binding protein